MSTAPPPLPGFPPVESPVDRALSLALQGERDSAIRWAAAVVKHDPTMPTALLLLGRLLGQHGKAEAARDALEIAVSRAIDVENLPLAVAAAEECARFGGDRDFQLVRVAEAFCKDSPRRGDSAPPPPPLPASFQPLPSHTMGRYLLEEAIAVVALAKAQRDSDGRAPSIAAHPLFSSMGKEGLFALCQACTALWVGTGATVIEQGTPGNEAYFVARGELEVRRLRGDETMVLARLTNGALFGEMALLARAPRGGSVVATRPSIVLEVKREALDKVADDHAEVGVEIASHCRDRMLENLVRTSRAIASVPEIDRPALLERFQTKIFERDERLIVQEGRSPGLFLIASGEVAVVRREAGGDPLVISTLGPGDIVGEVATVLRRISSADVLALHPTVTLFLPAADFMGLVHDHPAILKELYMLAVQRDEETRSIMEEEAAAAEDFVLV
jgi:cAMP-dependent protein kinase regulator